MPDIALLRIAYTGRVAEGFRTFDHTGDLGLEVWADAPERLYALAAEALLAQVVEAGSGAPDVRITLDLEGDDARDLIVHWLNSALLESELRQAVWTRAEVRSLSERALSGTLAGPRRDPLAQVFLREVKAVSHHDLALTLAPGRCHCRVILDI
jgi:SHS2 domain-containing protein